MAGQPFDRRIVRPALGRDALHASIFDPHLLSDQSQFLLQTVVLLLEPDAYVPAVGQPFGQRNPGTAQHWGLRQES